MPKVKKEGDDRKDYLKKRAQEQRDANNRLSRETRDAANAISGIPACKNPKNVKKATKSFEFFCKHYLKDWFFRKWAKAHHEVAKEFERIVLKGGQKGLAAPRGMFKTTFARAAVLWAVLCHPEKHPLVIYIGATEQATQRSQSIMLAQFIGNQDIIDDWPMICVPFLAYEGQARRRPKWKGVDVNASWLGNRIVLPTIEGSPYSAHSISFSSISSESLRGLDHTVGIVSERPTFVVVDDPQSDSGAASPSTVSSLLSILKAAILNLAGFDRKTKRRKKIAIIMICTCIQINDMASQIIDRKENPDFHGTKYQRMVVMPKNTDLWEKYREVRAISLNEHGDIRYATNFYKANREAMDEGAVCLDDGDYESGMLSGIQYGMDLWAKDPVSFYTESQNSPEEAKWLNSGQMTPIVVINKQVLLSRLTVPHNASILTAFIDVGDHYLNYEVVAFGKNMSFAHTVDYGVWPDQGVARISKTSYRFDLQEEYSDQGSTPDEKVELALIDLLDRIIDQPYTDTNQKPVDIHEETEYFHELWGHTFMRLAAIGIDCRYREVSVWRAAAYYISEHPEWRRRIIPCYGDSSKSRLMRFYELKPGEWQRDRKIKKNGRSSCDWIEFPDQTKVHRMELPTVETALKWDVNIFKTKRKNAWVQDIALNGAHSIFSGNDHEMYSLHQCSEEPVPVTIGGIAYDKWKKIKGGGDQEFLDTNTGCHMLADYVGNTSFGDLTDGIKPAVLKKLPSEKENVN